MLLQLFCVGLSVEYSSCFISVLNLEFFICYFDALMSLYAYELQQNLGRGLFERSKAVFLLWFILIIIVRPLSGTLSRFVSSV